MFIGFCEMYFYSRGEAGRGFKAHIPSKKLFIHVGSDKSNHSWSGKFVLSN